MMEFNLSVLEQDNIDKLKEEKQLDLDWSVGDNKYFITNTITLNDKIGSTN